MAKKTKKAPSKAPTCDLCGGPGIELETDAAGVRECGPCRERPRLARPLDERFRAGMDLLAHTCGEVRQLRQHVARLEKIVAAQLLGIDPTSKHFERDGKAALDRVGGSIQ